jgi:hypothetical protein
MLILLLPREHLFGNTGTNHNLFGKGDNVMKIPKRHVETAKKHLKLEHFFFVFKEIEHQIVPQKYFYSICILLFIIMLKYVFGAPLQMYPFSSTYPEPHFELQSIEQFLMHFKEISKFTYDIFPIINGIL